MKPILRFLPILFFLMAIFLEGCGRTFAMIDRIYVNQANTEVSALTNAYGKALCASDPSTYKDLYLFGGENNKVYLGCLTCDKFESESIWYAYGTYGSKYGSNSIWNKYGTYGSTYDSYSPWNQYSSSSPIILDENKRFYGYFTLYKYKSNRAEADWILKIYDNYEAIMDDVSDWHDRIF